MAESTTGKQRPSGGLGLVLLLLGIALIGASQMLHLHASQVTGAGGRIADGSLVGYLAEEVVVPLLRAFGDAEPSPVEIAAALRYMIFGAMALGLLLAILGARRVMLARRR